MHRYLSCVLPILLTVILITGCSREQPTSREANVTIRIDKGKAIRGIDLFLLIDESGSMYGENGTDPTGLRYEASKYLIQNLLVKKSEPKAPHRIAVIHFGDEAKAGEFVDVLPGNAAELVQSVQWTRRHLGNTSFIQALQAVKEISDVDLTPAHKRESKIVLLTDGTPDDRRRNQMTQADYFAEIQQYAQQELRAFTLYVVGIDNPKIADRFGQTASQWKQIAGSDNVFVVQQLRDLYTSFNSAIRLIFEIPPITPDFVAEDQTFEVQPYLDKLEFHLFTPSGMQLGIYSPDGQLVQTDDKNVTYQQGKEYDILMVDAPAPGTWQYKILAGQGQVVVFRNPIPFKLVLLEPPEVFPLGKKMRLKAKFIKDNGEAIEEIPEYPLAFVAKVIAPDRTEFNLQFLSADKEGDTHFSNREVPIEQAGEYLIRLTVKGGHQFETTSTEKVFVQSFPYVQAMMPQSGQTYARSARGLACTVQLHREGAPT
ncbi:TPA: VWA domain-containing protein, partial [Candidatus Poribacteria bacterium]|nr:VWA domain-containing protein [Candidatus Poribacteria bacterium]